MPTYSYQCKECLKVYSEIRSMEDAPTIESCYACKKPVTRLYEVRGVAFKGDGFYSNDKKTTLEVNI